MILLLTIICFGFGLIIGSFLNVVILRLNTSKSLGGRSACMSCQNTLQWYELLPLFSFLSLRGRCRSCKTKISIQYPLVEFITGLVFVLLFLNLQFLPLYVYFDLSFFVSFAYHAVLFCLLIVITTYDLRHKIIPDVLSFSFSIIAFIGMFFFINYGHHGFYSHIPSFLELFAGILIAFPFAFFWFVSGGRWMGLGDAKLALGIGWLLGIKLAISAITLAFWMGAIVGIGLILWKKGYDMKTEIPFAVYLSLGTFLVFIFNINLFFGF